MAELRRRKTFVRKQHLIDEWYRVKSVDRSTDRYPHAWWIAAQAAGLKAGCGDEAVIAFLQAEIGETRAA